MNHRIIEVGKDLEDHQVQLSSHHHHVVKCHIYKFFERLQGWRLHRFPGQPVARLYNSFSEETFPNSQSKPPLTQLEAIASRPIASYLGEGTNTLLTRTTFQVVVEMDKVSSQPPLIQAK